MMPTAETSGDVAELKTVLALPTEPLAVIPAKPEDLASRAVKAACAPARSAATVLAGMQGAFRGAESRASVVADSVVAVDSTEAAGGGGSDGVSKFQANHSDLKIF
jgi:hypothetical protein